MTEKRAPGRIRSWVTTTLNLDRTINHLDTTLTRLEGSLAEVDRTVGDLGRTIEKLDATLDRLSHIVMDVDADQDAGEGDARGGLAGTVTEVGALADRLHILVDGLEAMVGPALRLNEQVRRLGRRTGPDAETEP